MVVSLPNWLGDLLRTEEWSFPCWTGQVTCCIQRNGCFLTLVTELSGDLLWTKEWLFPCWTGQVTCCGQRNGCFLAELVRWPVVDKGMAVSLQNWSGDLLWTKEWLFPCWSGHCQVTCCGQRNGCFLAEVVTVRWPVADKGMVVSLLKWSLSGDLLWTVLGQSLL